MARQKKERIICSMPCHRSFAPTQTACTEFVTLQLDEFEALRLHDLEGMKQAQVGVQMKISRPSVAALLDAAHKKIADALTNGKEIRIEDSDGCVCPIGKACPHKSVCPQKCRCGGVCRSGYCMEKQQSHCNTN